ncbi:MAG: transglutaminase-like domain-containing protein [Capsulimonadaceae bacterium]
MKLSIRFRAVLRTPAPTPVVLMIEPASNQTVLDSTFTLSPAAATESLTDNFGNPLRRLRLPRGRTTVEYSAVVLYDRPPEVEDPGVDPDILTLPADVLQFTLPSRYCHNDKFASLAADLFGDCRPGLARVQDITTWIHEHVAYRFGASDISSSAADTVIERAGVCRDFAHVGIAFCRALNIPARYAAGYCLDLKPQDLHAYYEAYVNGVWVPFDATSEQPRPALVRIGFGYDASSCAWATLYGPGHTEALDVSVIEIVEPAESSNT